jgi:hypothetical protein
MYTYIDISGTRYFKNRKDGNADFTTRLVSKGGVYSWYEGSTEDNSFLLEKAGFVPHEHCRPTPYLAHVKANPNCKVDMELFRTDMLDVKIQESSGSKKRKATDSERKEQWSREAANDIQESRKHFEDAITKKWNKLSLLDNYCNAFSDNQIIQLKDLPLGSYNVMAMRETQTQYGEKYIMLIDRNGTLRLCYSNKFIETYTYVKTCLAPRRRRFANLSEITSLSTKNH